MPVMKTMLNVVARVSNRVFVGLPICECAGNWAAYAMSNRSRTILTDVLHAYRPQPEIPRYCDRVHN